MKYKLIKAYPGSPTLGIKVEVDSDGWCCTSCNLNPQDYPEFWEKIVEKEYEILSFKTTDKHSGFKNILSVLQNDNNYNFKDQCNNTSCTLDEMLISVNKGYNIIHSVKRLSDGCIFTIGDTIFSNDYKPTKLEKITIRDNGVIAMWGKYHSNMLGEIGLASCIIKQPLFTTEDGLDIYDGDKIHSVDRDLLISKDDGRYITKDFVRSSRYKYFSNREKAEEYILMNKPCLSINDVLSVGQRVIVDEGKLKQIVKSKI